MITRRDVFLIGIFAIYLSSCGSLVSKSRNEKARDDDKEGTSEGWVSSGGELIEDQKNPWWIQNIQEIRYCILNDAEDFSASQIELNDSFIAAFSYWKKDFSAMASDFGPNAVQVATQELSEVKCENQNDSSVDLFILAGESTLTKKQRTWFGNKLERIVGIAVRTSYDRVNLKGKGFIYLRGDRDKEHTPWKDPKMLNRLLIHELGHVFGLDHKKDSVMEEDAPAYWFETDYRNYDYANLAGLPPSFSFTEGIYQCTVSILAGYFAHENYDDDSSEQEYFPCLELKKGELERNTWEVYVGKNQSSMSYVGKMVSERVMAGWRADESNFYLPSEQVVIDESDEFLLFQYQFNLNQSGYYKFLHKDGWSLDNLSVNIGPSSIFIDHLILSETSSITIDNISFIRKAYGDWLF